MRTGQAGPLKTSADKWPQIRNEQRGDRGSYGSGVREILTAQANASDGNTESSSSSATGWHNLPDDLVGMVRRRISSPRDRVRLAAVCRPWHDAASRLPAQPAVPALILSPYGRSKKKHMCGPCDSWVLRVPGKAVRKRFVGSHHGGWIAAKDDHQLVIVNLFSGVEVPLTANQKMIASIPTVKGPHNIKKIIFSEDPASSDGCVLAAITHEGNSIAVCRVGCRDGRWSAHL
ncbi:uncharacterized protein [Aegilops tauschii subsp. strangulata]|uniref:uncharacterized protein n=1 Tax=Aegilops tauschii subsp. strangulata TaxID=200361 RepID=UPI003CC88498